MKLISNRGNITGISEEQNKPEYMEKALELGYDVKTDLWLVENMLYTGDNEPMYKLDLEWLEKYREKLWLHCHDLEIISRLYDIDLMGVHSNYFFKEREILSKTSKGYYILSQEKPFKGCIYMYPENHPDYAFDLCLGVISNEISKVANAI